MSSAVSHPKLDNSAEENDKDLNDSEENRNLMNHNSKGEDNYLETLRHFGITVKCVPKRNTVKPEAKLNDNSKKETEKVDDEVKKSIDDNDSIDINKFLNNSSISIVKKVKPTPKPSTPPADDVDDPIAKLNALGSGVSIQRKKSIDNSNLNTESKPEESSITENEVVTILKKPIRKSIESESSQPPPPPPVPAPAPAPQTPVENTGSQKSNEESDANSSTLNSNKIETNNSKEPSVERSTTSSELEKRPVSTTPSEGKESILAETSSIRSRCGSSASYTSQRNKSRRNSTNSLASNEPTAESEAPEHSKEASDTDFNNDSENNLKITVKTTRRGRGRPPRSGQSTRTVQPARSVQSTRGRPNRRTHHYESDEDFDCHVRTYSATRRQTRGKKISLSNYSESEESDFERYINESSESPIHYPNETENKKSSELKSKKNIDEHIDFDPEQEIKEEKLDEENLESEEYPPEEHEEPEKDQEQSEKPSLVDDSLSQQSTNSKISISIIKNEDYSEVLKAKSNLPVNEETTQQVPEDIPPEIAPSETSEDNSHFFGSRSVTPGAASSVDYLSDSSKNDEAPHKKRRLIQTSTSQTERYPSDDLFCWYCKRNFSKKTLFWRHISSHIRLPYVYLTRVTKEEIEQHCGVGYKYIPSNKMSSLKLTLKTNDNHEFEIINKDNQNSQSEYEEFENGAENMDLEANNATTEDNMELDETVGNVDENMDVEDSQGLADVPDENATEAVLDDDTDNYEDPTGTNEVYEEAEETAEITEEVSEDAEKSKDTAEGGAATEKQAETPQQTYIPGVRIRSLESVQRPESNQSHQSSSASPSTQQSSPTLRVRTNLTSPQNNINHMPNQLTQPNMYGQQDPYGAQNQHGYGNQNPYMNQQQMNQPQSVYNSQNMAYNPNTGYSTYSSYNQTTYVQNGNFSPNPAYWSNSGGDNTDPLAMQPEEDPLKLPTSGEKEQETHGHLLKSFLDGNNSANVTQMNNDNPAMAEFMPLDRLISSTTCPMCSERFPDIQALEEHKRRLNHYAAPGMPHPQNALQPLGSSALQSLASAHSMGSNMQQIQHQIRVQHNVIVNNVIQQPPMAPLPPYGQPQSMVDNSMQQLTQQVNRMPPPNSQYGPYGPNQSAPYGQQGPYRLPALPAPPNTSQPYNQNGHYGSQYGQYSNSQPIPLPPPNSSSGQAQSPTSQYQQRGAPPPRPGAPGVQSVRPRGQAYLPTTQAGPPPPPSGMRGPPRPQYRPGPLSRTRGPLGPRMQGPPQRPSPPINQATRMRRPMPASIQQQNDQKRKRMDMLIPDRHEDPDCHVIAVQQRNDDLPVIQNIQGNVTETPQDALSKVKDSMIHLTDSITLSVRGKEQNNSTQNSQPPQKSSPASAVADILATRGITVTPAAKSGEQSKSNGNDSAVAQVAINLNNSVSIIPKTNSQVDRPPRPPSTVDLTDDPPSSSPSSLVRPNKPYKCSICPKQFNSQDLYTSHVTKHRTLPFRCDHCSAAYPKQIDLINHKKNCRGASNSASDLGLPIIDLRRPQVMQSLSRLGIHHYIPLAQGNGVFGLPVVSVEGARNPNIINLSALGSNNLLPLGPVRQIPIQNRPH